VSFGLATAAKSFLPSRPEIVRVSQWMPLVLFDYGGPPGHQLFLPRSSFSSARARGGSIILANKAFGPTVRLARFVPVRTHPALPEIRSSEKPV
jgi:hypothetical protein